MSHDVTRTGAMKTRDLRTRRRVFQQIGAVAAAASAMPLWQRSCLAEDKFTPLNRFPRMVHEFLVAEAQAAGERNQMALEQLSSRQDAEVYVESARQRIQQSFGPMPERTPLNPKIMGVIEREDYRIEKIIFESRPGFPVTANLYLPKNQDKRVPAAVGTCGHSVNGKAAEAYQSFAQGLARLGIACLIYDPIGQGERLQYVTQDLKPKVGTGTSEHLYAGNQQFLVGEFFGMWRAWDGIRALDYLQTRGEIDPNRIGVTGNSGGGTMTTWLCGLDPRWAMAAPSCFVTTFRRNLENELPQDTEQCPPKALALNLDHCDFLAAMAPKPVIILAKERDYFDVRGAEETYSRLKRLYRLLGAEGNVGLFIGPSEHGFSQENREAMYAWFLDASSSGSAGQSAAESGSFSGVLKVDKDLAFVPEPALKMEPEQDLWCTPRGQVAELEGTQSIFEYTRDKAVQLKANRMPKSGSALEKSIVDVLKLPSFQESPPDYRNYRFLGSRGYPTQYAMGYSLETEPGVFAVVYRMTEQRWHSRPPAAGRRALLYVSHLSADQELRDESWIGDTMQAEDAPLFSCDVRGVGESLPATSQPGSFHDSYGSDYFYAIHSLMLDRPYLGQKTFDLLRVLSWLKSIGHDDIHLLGMGWGALAATFAAVLSKTVTQVTLKHALTAYQDVAESETYSWPLSTVVPNILAEFDLPDCYAELKSKQLRLIEPWGATAVQVARNK
ncbi:MAG: acetylxylan esterase [bacterium]|nr:acetylxylan esterase [bacterium]